MRQATAGTAAILNCSAPQTHSSSHELLSENSSPFLWKVMMTDWSLVLGPGGM